MTSQLSAQEERTRAEPHYRRVSLQQRFKIVKYRMELLDAQEEITRVKAQLTITEERSKRVAASELEARVLGEHLAGDVVRLAEIIHIQALKMQDLEEKLLEALEKLGTIPVQCGKREGCFCGGITGSRVELQQLRQEAEDELATLDDECPRTATSVGRGELLGPIPDTQASKNLSTPNRDPQVSYSPASPKHVPLEGDTQARYVCCRLADCPYAEDAPRCGTTR